MSTFSIFRLLACFTVGACSVRAETIVAGDVTSQLGPYFFLDEAARGGADTDAAHINFDISFSGLVVGDEGCDLILTGMGWASRAAGTTATRAAVSVTYLGADGVAGGGDDLVIGSVTDDLVFSGASEYVWRFDEPLLATIDGSNTNFRINVNTLGTGIIGYKNVNGTVKLSVAGSSSAVTVHNLALHREVTASSNQDFARYATDGVVGDDFKWIMAGGASVPETLDIAFPGPVEIGSYHLYVGANNLDLLRAWKLQYRLNGSAWADVPGSAVADNTASEVSVILPPILVDELRLRITQQGGTNEPRIREWAVFAPNGGNGVPLGTGVTLNMAQGGLTTADSNAAGQYPLLATDGYLGTRWVSDATGPHTLEVVLRDEIDIGSIHVYSGDGTPGSGLTDFELEFSRPGTTVWGPVPVGSISDSSSGERVVTFSAGVLADRVRLTTTNDGPVSIRELVVFPDNDAGGYPSHTDVRLGQPPPAQFEIYRDDLYRIRSVSADRVLTVDATGVVLVEPHDLDVAQAYQLLYNGGSGHFRIFNRHTRNCLAVKDASPAAGAEILEEPYGAFPSQQWRVIDTGGGRVTIENVLSRMRLEAAGNRIVQRLPGPTSAQAWTVDFLRGYPKKGIAGYAQFAADMEASWYYGWGPEYPRTLDTNLVDANPMQWGNFSWDPDGYQNLPLTVRYPGWRSRGHPFYLFGFNEPDGAEQANITVEKAISFWPRLMASGLPLASPAAIGPTRQWMIDWMDEATARGYRIDALAMHTYPGPDAASVVANLEQFSADHDDRPVMLTEFGFVDWNKSSGWPENQLYHEMLELLWRLEHSPACRRYSLFGFVANPDWPQPADPTGNTYRSNWMNENGTFTALGELYMGWEGDTTPNADQPYILHNRAFDMRVRNDGSTAVDAVTIRTGDATAQVIFESIGNGYYYLVSSLDGKRLRRAGPNAVEWAPSTTVATDAQWTWSPVETGWQLVSNRNGGNLRYTDADGVHLGTGSGTYYHWFLVPPMNPVDSAAPAPPTGLTASPSHRQVTLEWTGSLSLDADSYTVRRSITPGGPYTPVATGVVADSYADTGLVNGTPYYYLVDTIDGAGQSGTSEPVSATPVAPDPVTYADWALVAFEGAPGGTDTSESGNPDQDEHSNFGEFVFFLNPLAADSVDMGITAESDADILIRFRVNRHATGITVNLGCDDGLAGAPGWTNCPYSVRSQTNIGDQVELEVQAEDPPPNTAFFRIDARMD